MRIGWHLAGAFGTGAGRETTMRPYGLQAKAWMSRSGRNGVPIGFSCAYTAPATVSGTRSDTATSVRPEAKIQYRPLKPQPSMTLTNSSRFFGSKKLNSTLWSLSSCGAASPEEPP